MQKALFFTKEDKGEVGCYLCNHHCRIKNNQRGLCDVRWNKNGVLYSLNYAKLVAANVDPIEKKPLFHFFPGSLAYSIASAGCNFKCDFCQNWQISQFEEAERFGVKGMQVSPEQVVSEALNHGCKSISYTYTEPTVYFEFAFKCAKLAKQKGLYNNFVTNGYMSKDALRFISPFLDAANVDLKSFREDFYRRQCKAHLEPVLENIRLMKQLGIWVEITTLIVPGYNDSREELSDIASFIADLDVNIPWHISRFHPDYKFTGVSPTKVSLLQQAYDIGKDKGLKFVYIGNVHTDYGETTFCPSCSKPLVQRTGFSIGSNQVKQGRCGFCGEEIRGIGW